jgi:site-specific recombinase XerD
VTSLKARVMLSILYGCGLRAGEVVRLRVCDIDSTQMIIRVVQSKGRKRPARDAAAQAPRPVAAMVEGTADMV